VEVLWKLTKRGFEQKVAFPISAAVKGSRGCVKLIDAVGEAVRTTVDVGNSCGDDGPVLGPLLYRHGGVRLSIMECNRPVAFILHCIFNRRDSSGLEMVER
jgi:hypothetical protein